MARGETASVVPFARAADAVESTPPRPVTLARVELPRARRPGWPTLAALAIATGLAAVGLGVWSVLGEARSEPSTAEDTAVSQSLAVLADSTATRFSFRGSVGRIALVVTESGDAVLALDGLGPAPEGSVYQAWLVPEGSATPLPDASFDAVASVVPLERRVPSGTRVAVTLEPTGDATRPSRPLRLSAVRR
jgi:hypothetical protein